MSGCTAIIPKIGRTITHALCNLRAVDAGTQDRGSAMKASIGTRVVVAILFVAMLATPLAIKQVSARQEEAQAKLDESQALARYGFHLQEVSQQAGVTFIHQAPTLDAKLEGIMPEVASMGASVSIVDFDRDGWPDLYVTNSTTGSQNPSVSQYARWYLPGCCRADGHCRCKPGRQPASPWERSGETMTMTVTKTCF